MAFFCNKRADIRGRHGQHRYQTISRCCSCYSVNMSHPFLFISDFPRYNFNWIRVTLALAQLVGLFFSHTLSSLSLQLFTNMYLRTFVSPGYGHTIQALVHEHRTANRSQVSGNGHQQVMSGLHPFFNTTSPSYRHYSHTSPHSYSCLRGVVLHYQKWNQLFSPKCGLFVFFSKQRDRCKLYNAMQYFRCKTVQKENKVINENVSLFTCTPVIYSTLSLHVF